jgi:hypothetical protein
VSCPACGRDAPLDAPSGVHNGKWLGLAKALELVGVLTLVISAPLGLLLIIGAALPVFALETPTGKCRLCGTWLTQNWLGHWRTDRAA